MLRRSIAYGAVLVICLGLALVAPPPALAASAVVVAGPPGEIVVQVSGFEANERVSTWLTAPDLSVVPSNNHRMDGQGERSFSVRIPRFFQTGRWAITVHGLSSGREAVAYFYVPPRLPDAPLAVNPTRLAPGETFVATGAGFQPRENISYWFTAPDGRSVPGDFTLAGPDGSVAFSYTMSLSSPGGLWALSAYGESSDRLGVAFFAVVGAAGAPITPAGLRPEESTAAFYAWYLAYPGGALATGAYRGSPFLTDLLKQHIEAQVVANPGFDPVVCATTLPGGVRTSAAAIVADRARVEVQTDLPHSFVVGLRIVDGQWKLDEINCSAG
jgi:hypothetical protein